MPHVDLPRKQEIRDDGDGVDQGGEKWLARPHFLIARALIFLSVDHLKTVGLGEGFELRNCDQRVEEGRERRLAGESGILVAAHMAVEPDVEPVRRILGDDAGE